MKAFSPSRGFGMYVAVALLAGCGGASQLGSNQTQPNAPQTRANPALIDRGAAAHVAPGRSWMASNLTKKDLLYVSNFYSSGTLVFTYPSGKLVGTLTGVGTVACASASSGDWWTSGNDEMLEYAHGGKSPIKTLTGASGACAVDPTTGDLAVLNFNGDDIIIYPGGSGSGTAYCTGIGSAYFDGYDDRGDLFIDGITQGNAYGLVELPKGGSTCESITLSQKLEFPGAIQWFDKYLAVGDQEAGAIYHFAIHGTNAKEIGTTELGGSSDVVQFYIQKPYVAGADAGNEDVELWKYPAGGPIFKTLQGSFDLPIGLIVSVGKKR
ncbi:MAG: hypothetical protein WB526_13135 [Candidatus Cybelea sp.]